jgi:hypothetical protein
VCIAFNHNAAARLRGCLKGSPPQKRGHEGAIGIVLQRRRIKLTEERTKMAKEKVKFPNEIFVVMEDLPDRFGNVDLGALQSLQDINENHDGEIIATYQLKRTWKFKVQKILEA